MHCNFDLSAALSKARPGDTIMIPEGTYRGKFTLSVPNVTLSGSDPYKTVIINNDFAKKIHSDGLEYNTFRTYTLAVTAPGITLKNLSIVNDAGDPSSKGQCVALTVYADSFSASDVVLDSTQDTLFCGPLPDDLITRYIDFLPDDIRYAEGSFKHIFSSCVIKGSVDFIFGCADALFDKCSLISVNDGRNHGFVAAPAHSLKQTVGFVFFNCNFESIGLDDSSVFLARPWRDYGKCSFIDCSYAPHINSLGFDKWNDTERNRTARFSELPLLKGREPWAIPLSRAEADALLSYFRR